MSETTKQRTDRLLGMSHGQLVMHAQDLTHQRDELLAALKQFAECDLNEGNCASLEVATRRIRTVAHAAIARREEGK